MIQWRGKECCDAAKLNLDGAALTRTFTGRVFELYDVINDPDELANLAELPEFAETLAGLQGKLRQWQVSTSDPWISKYQHE